MRAIHLIAAVVLVGLSMPAAAQSGRAIGTVTDVDGNPIKGAVIRAANPESPRGDITSTTDDRGRFAVIGLRAGIWAFTAEAPGFEPHEASVPIRSGAGGPLVRLVLQRTPAPMPGALSRDIAEQISRAQALHDAGRLDQALAAYRSIREANPRLTTVGLVIGGLYRRQAEATQDQATRRALMQQALAVYADVLQSDADNDRARLELGTTQLASGDLVAGRATLQGIIAARPGSPAAAEATAHLQGIRE